MNVVVGNSFGHDTPVFADTMAQVVFRPYWAVPLSIVRSELIPHILKDPGYLTKKGFEIVDSQQKVIGTWKAVGDSVSQLRAGKLFIRQVPGRKTRSA
jgi:murein L,D-transpeptidase YcbB/YkuD